MLRAKYFLASRNGASFIRDFDGHVRECALVARRTVRFRDEEHEGWYVRPTPPLPLRADDVVGLPDSDKVVTEVLVMAGDGQRPGEWADGAGSVLVYAVAGDRLASQAILVDEDLVAQGRAEMADDRARFVDLEHIFFDQNIGRRYTREEYIEHLRRELPDQVLRAEADLGAIDQWENLALAAFHYRFDRPPRRTLSDG